MYKSFKKRIAAQLESLSIHSDTEIRLYIISFVAILFCMISHTYLLVAYAANGVFLFTVLNIISIGLYSFMFVLHRRLCLSTEKYSVWSRKYTAPSITEVN
jgi:hypothetical protein